MFSFDTVNDILICEFILVILLLGGRGLSTPGSFYTTGECTKRSVGKGYLSTNQNTSLEKLGVMWVGIKKTPKV